MVRYLAEHDELAGLLSRSGFYSELNKIIYPDQGKQSNIALMLIDLDRFKQVNDAFGHKIGDKLLIHIAKLLIRLTGVGDLVARLGGDEFAIIMRNPHSLIEVVSPAEQILSELNLPVEIDSHTLQSAASIGISITPRADNTISATQMLQQADLALYKVKKQGGLNYQVYDDRLAFIANKQRLWEQEMISLLQKQELMLYFQPRYNYQIQRVVGVEALLRPQHPKHGLMDPENFLEIIERSGLSYQVSIWLLENVCNQVVCWRKRGIEFGRLAWNLSAIELNQKGFVERICQTMKTMQVPGEYIEIEITERHKINDFAAFADNLRPLRALGITITLDDLGTEYSSLQRLLECNIDVIKIDKYFVQQIGHKKAELVIELLIDLGQKMQIEVIAEGVETRPQLDYLLSKGCSVIQGFYYAKPMPDKEMSNYLLASKPSKQ